MQTGRPDILVVDDDPWIVELIVMAAEERDWTVVSAAERGAALELVAGANPRLVLLDVHLPRHSGWSVLAELKRLYPDQPPIIMMTADHDGDDKASELGAATTLHKPFGLQSFLDLLAQYLA